MPDLTPDARVVVAVRIARAEPVDERPARQGARRGTPRSWRRTGPPGCARVRPARRAQAPSPCRSARRGSRRAPAGPCRSDRSYRSVLQRLALSSSRQCHCPVRIAARLGVHDGDATKALLEQHALRASRSKVGVCHDRRPYADACGQLQSSAIASTMFGRSSAATVPVTQSSHPTASHAPLDHVFMWTPPAFAPVRHGRHPSAEGRASRPVRRSKRRPVDVANADGQGRRGNACVARRATSAPWCQRRAEHTPSRACRLQSAWSSHGRRRRPALNAPTAPRARLPTSGQLRRMASTSSNAQGRAMR